MRRSYANGVLVIEREAPQPRELGRTGVARAMKRGLINVQPQGDGFKAIVAGTDLTDGDFAALAAAAGAAMAAAWRVA